MKFDNETLAQARKVLLDRLSNLGDGIELAGFTKEDVNSALLDGAEATAVNMAEKILRAEYIEGEFPDGEAIEIDCCDDCNIWFAGDRRCSCGGVRIDLETYGKFLSDDHAYVYPINY
jgi:hypothetical protein